MKEGVFGGGSLFVPVEGSKALYMFEHGIKVCV